VLSEAILRNHHNDEINDEPGMLVTKQRRARRDDELFVGFATVAPKDEGSLQNG